VRLDISNWDQESIMTKLFEAFIPSWHEVQRDYLQARTSRSTFEVVTTSSFTLGNCYCAKPGCRSCNWAIQCTKPCMIAR
ncbi:MAG TPA: hypothetical protein VHV10_03635, partial [Ktedonobacteraceae bacterium]|nr:hypothetical protein [Ktedonobacteraceae bacterium]